MNKKNIQGRESEQMVLKELWESSEAEFLAIYGRRRVGKTHLIREFFSNKGVYFELTGMHGANLAEQLENFIDRFAALFFNGAELRRPTSWRAAFKLLSKEIAKLGNNKIVVFLDELPWLASKKSGVVAALDYFWNSEWSLLPNVKLVVCGSAASWMLDHVINAKGGLHNRLTRSLRLEPFSLRETQAFLKNRGVRLNQQQVLDIYMVTGGVAHYLRNVRPGMSAAQVIDTLCFHKNGPLVEEFNRLFHALFDSAEVNMVLIEEIAARPAGISRTELLNTPRVQAAKLSSGGTFSKRINELTASGFIKAFVPYGNKKKETYYRVIDEYSLFYLRFMKEMKPSIGGDIPEGYWLKKSSTPPVLSWRGTAMESICFKHLEQIRRALDLDKMISVAGSWRFQPKKGSRESGCQIDLLFDRSDEAVSICEIKYSQGLFVIDKAYAKALARKIDVFEEHFPGKQLFLVMVTTSGVKRNLWSEDLVKNEVLLKDLFT